MLGSIDRCRGSYGCIVAFFAGLGRRPKFVSKRSYFGDADVIGVTIRGGAPPPSEPPLGYGGIRPVESWHAVPTVRADFPTTGGWVGGLTFRRSYFPVVQIGTLPQPQA